MNFGCTPVAPGDLMARLEARVQQLAKLSADRCFLTLVGPDKHLRMPPADQFITLFPASFPVWQGVVSGAGDFYGAADGENLGFDAAVQMTVYNRLSADQELRASEQVASATLGIFAGVMNLVTALQMWEAPTDADPDASYLREPMRLADGGVSFVPKSLETGTWALATCVLQVRFTAKLGDQ